MTIPALAYIDIISGALPLGAGFYRFRTLRREMLVFLAYVLLNAGTEIVTFVMALHRINNLWVLHIYDLLEYALLMIVFSYWQESESPERAIAMRASIFLFGIFWLLSKLTGLEPFQEPSVYTHTTSAVVLIAAVVMMLISLAKNERSGTLRDPRLWLTIGMLLSFTGNVMLFLLGKEFVQLSFMDAKEVSTIHWFITISVNFIFTLGFISVRR